MAEPPGVRVEIFDQVYHLRAGSEGDAEQIKRVAAYVDAKIRNVASKTRDVDSLRLAVLAALNIADEFHVLKRKYDAIAGEYRQRADHLSGALDEVLGDGSRRAG